MIAKSRLHPGFAGVTLNVAPGSFARYIGHYGRLFVQSMQRAYDARRENAQMRFAPTKPRSWSDVRRAEAGRH
jgi:hypothetical protein